ncbi:AMP-binding enzyme C-terminal domain, partial [Trinorchestia longiramus]
DQTVPVEGFREVQDSVCVGQRRNVDGEERVVLFLKLMEQQQLTPRLMKAITTAIRQQLSARHVPSVILPIADIPYTVSGKKVEVAVRQTVHGEEVANRNALVNPEALDLYRDLPQLAGW